MLPFEVTIYNRHISKARAQKFRKEELDENAHIKIATSILHENVYSVCKQGEGSKLKIISKEIEKKLTN